MGDLTVSDPKVDAAVDFTELPDGQYEAECECGWVTTGTAPVVEDAAFEHVYVEVVL